MIVEVKNYYTVKMELDKDSLQAAFDRFQKGAALSFKDPTWEDFMALIAEYIHCDPHGRIPYVGFVRTAGETGNPDSGIQVISAKDESRKVVVK